MFCLGMKIRGMFKGSCFGIFNTPFFESAICLNPHADWARNIILGLRIGEAFCLFIEVMDGSALDICRITLKSGDFGFAIFDGFFDGGTHFIGQAKQGDFFDIFTSTINTKPIIWILSHFSERIGNIIGKDPGKFFLSPDTVRIFHLLRRKQ